jgi:ElaB/YqjD/DUF883 family membrane-anchored ribosome-binding protein
VSPNYALQKVNSVRWRTEAEIWRPDNGASRNNQIETPMTRRAHDVTKQQLIEEFNVVVTETEHLLKSVANAGGDKIGALRTSVEQNLASAKDRLRAYQDSANDKAKEAVKATDTYVHEHPWHAIGVAAGVNIIAGLVLGLLLHRR